MKKEALSGSRRESLPTKILKEKSMVFSETTIVQQARIGFIQRYYYKELAASFEVGPCPLAKIDRKMEQDEIPLHAPLVLKSRENCEGQKEGHFQKWNSNCKKHTPHQSTKAP